MKEKNAWHAPGWPWELEILTVLFVAAAILVPYYFFSMAALPGTESMLAQGEAGGMTPAERAIIEQNGLLWAVGILGFFFIHVILASSTIDFLSTPFTHLVAPIVFSIIAYYRVYVVSQAVGRQAAFATGDPLQITGWILAIIVITLLVARVRMARHLLGFRHTKWDINTPTHMDSSYVEACAHLHPLIYVPRLYRACNEGILIEGWFYIMVIPFHIVQSITSVAHATMASSGHHYTTSARNLLRMELLDNSLPIYISPTNRDEFLKYCAHHVSALRHSNKSGDTRNKSTHGSSGHTHAGIANHR